MFDSIAPTYDRLNHRLSWHIDKYWRQQALRPLRQQQPRVLLDIATGTADLALLAAQTLHPTTIVAADISEQMMAIGQRKVEEAGLEKMITFATEDCMALSFADDTFDAVTAAFGIRNFQDLDKGLTEIWRVLRKGGLFSAIETTTPPHFPLRQLFRLYAQRVIPRWGQQISGDREAYEYLTQTITAFPQGETMRQILLKVGFTAVHIRRMTGGICTRYVAVK